MQWEIIMLFFLVAFVYASVGFGGGSSYLAILSLFEFDYLTLRALALLCNITVVMGTVYVFSLRKLIRWKQIWPLLLFSVPAAYLGGRMPIDERDFFILLGITLLLASLAMFLQRPRIQSIENQKTNGLLNSVIGGGVGFLSGLVGIGGGIFLSPVLHLLKWERSIIIASTASVYILANSIAGLIGQSGQLNFSTLNLTFILSLVIAVFIGGQLGVRIGIMKFNPIRLKQMTAILVMIVAIRIFIKYLF